MDTKSCFFIGHRDASEEIHPEERPIPTPDGFDRTFYPPGMESVPRKVAIVRANRYVVDHVDYLIAYAWHPASNGTGAGGVRKKSTKKSFPFHNNVKMSRLDKN